MKLARRIFLSLTAAAAVLPTMSPIAMAENYPAQPVRVIVPFGSSGATDIVARLIAQWLSDRLGQQFIVENRPGAGSNLGTAAVIRSAPDSYTLLLVGPPAAINATLYEKLSFNFLRDIAPIAGIVRFPNVMVVHPSVPVTTVAELIAYAKANPGKINFASTGLGQHTPCQRRVVQDDGRHQHSSRAVPQRGGCDDRSAQRSGASRFRRVDHVASPHPIGRAAFAGHGGKDSVRSVTGCPSVRSNCLLHCGLQKCPLIF
jgi:tripartite-type tricarboxylate transporter receptor subunit TctC